VASATEADPRASADTGRSGFLPDRIIHLHPTRLCNLACLHCYSDSDPRQSSALDPIALVDALAALRAEGYTAVSLSGGEPLVYKPLAVVIDRAHALGLRVTMITNGLLVNERMDPLLAQLDGIAVSFDGMAESHNTIRRRPDSFGRACAAIERLAAADRPVAAAISLSRDGIAELPDLVDHLVDIGARRFQVRPVARAGRAKGLPAGTFFGAADRARLYLVVLALQRELPEIRLHCDLAPAHGLWQQRDAYAGLLGSCEAMPYADRPLADLVNPLVITDAGTLKPIAYDFAAPFDIGSIDALGDGALRAWKQDRLAPLQALIGGAVAGLQDRSDLVDWFDHCARLSEGAAALA
jgi:pyruvate-formate lyase-activating enzyme